MLYCRSYYLVPLQSASEVSTLFKEEEGLFHCHQSSPPKDQIQLSMAVFSSLANGESLEENRMKCKPAGRRRIFVQTYTGCVLAVDLDRDDNAHTVKRKLQVS